MKFIHIADLHLDSPFTTLSDKEGYGDIIRIEQRKAIKKVIEYIEENKIPYLFISGDLYEQKYIRESTIQYINNLFKQIPETQIYIAPGNHDPYIKNSYYNQYEWSKNVTIFKEQIQIIETEEADIYGFGFSDFYCEDSKIEEIEIKNKDKINILVMHGSIDSSKEETRNYNPIPKKILKEKGFNYCALGHIHKPDYNQEENQNIIYPGSTIAMGFDELGEHGMIEGELTKESIKIEFKKIGEIEFEEKEIDCTTVYSIEELAEEINNFNYEENKLYKIILNGKRNIEINKYKLLKLNLNKQIIKIKDKTKLNYNIEEEINENTLKGIFIKEMLEKQKRCENDEEKQIIEKAIEIGLEVLE